MWYHYLSPIGIFWIRPQPNRPGSYWLGLDDEPLKSYRDPQDAVKDVYNQCVGFDPWDRAHFTAIPACLADWSVGKPAEAEKDDDAT